jgi:hypothetical protein
MIQGTWLFARDEKILEKSLLHLRVREIPRYKRELEFLLVERELDGFHCSGVQSDLNRLHILRRPGVNLDIVRDTCSAYCTCSSFSRLDFALFADDFGGMTLVKNERFRVQKDQHCSQ